MLPRPDSRYSLCNSSHPATPTPYQHPASAAFLREHHHGDPMDPSCVDFHAFYPYTPNEVKHRKRTTPAQQKRLEAVFKRDTKPNGPLRVELASELGMTPRGVQVWFQNRRAKEKIKAGKLAKADRAEVPGQDVPHSTDDTERPPDSPMEAKESPPLAVVTDDLISNSPSASPPIVANELSQRVWEEVPIAAQSLYADSSLHAYRRGSLPVSAFPHAELSPNSPPLVDEFDPFARRLSVDASLQRLAQNPYAPLARAKNGALFGPRPYAPVRNRPLGRTPSGTHLRACSTAMPYRLDVRRASLGAFRPSPQSTASPSPSPLSPYHVGRASLPDHQLYAVTSRTVSSPIPGPLPTPNFVFGAANTPSMTSGESERNSPDSLQSFSYREAEQDEDDGNLASYHMRFRSIASISTSDSSLNSAYYADVVGSYPDGEHHYPARRGSCASVQFASLMSGLDVNGMQDSYEQLHEDMSASGIVRVDSNGICVETSAYPSPTSTISPGSGDSPLTHSCPPPSVPISRSSELAFALDDNHGQVRTHFVHMSSSDGSDQDQTQAVNIPDIPASYEGHTAESSAVEKESIRSDQYTYFQNAHHPQATNATPLEYDIKHTYDYDSGGSYLTENYSLLEGGDLNVHHQSFAPPSMPYPGVTLENMTSTVDVYVSYV